MFEPPFSTARDFLSDLRARGFSVLRAADVRTLSGAQEAGERSLAADWSLLEPDAYLKDGGHYRRRRHASFTLEASTLDVVPYRPHWQPRAYNALHGGMERWFTPIAPATLAAPDWRALLVWFGRIADAIDGTRRWYGEAHQFRVDTAGGIGRPTPEGAHRDGVDFVAVVLVARQGITGGETRVFELDGPNGQRFTLEEPWSVLLLQDPRMIHETTPIQPCAAGVLGWRDTLVLTLRAGGFMAAPGA